MPTGANSDLVPVQKATKRRLARLKGDATYDALLVALLELVPERELEARLRPGAFAREARERPPEKQLMIARLAAQRWKDAVEEGRIVPLGPRLARWRERPAGPPGVRFTVGRRGLAP